MLERMSDFFENRIDSYDEHMMTNIESAREFYPFTASCLPMEADASVLDLGCGTGLELREYFKLNPSAEVMGIDLSEKMLKRLVEALPGKKISLTCESYFDAPFGINIFDAAVSVESLHHFTKEKKIPLYKKLYDALKDGGYFILTDYFALSDDEEKMHQSELEKLILTEGASTDETYHYDTPLTVAHETEALLAAGFSSVEIIGKWGATHTLRARK